MKNVFNQLTVMTVSAMVFVGCSGDSGKSSNVTVGQAGGQIATYPNESCTINTSDYSCTQILNGATYSTSIITFVNQQEFCSKINNYQLNTDPRTYQQVAMQTRNSLFSQRCQNVVPGGVTPQYPYPTTPTTGSMDGFKSFTCQLQVKKGQAVYQGEPQHFYLPKSGGRTELFAYTMVNRRVAWFFQTTRMARIAKVMMQYNPALTASSQSMDSIKMSLSNLDGDTSASVEGFAGAENRIEITPSDLNDGSERTQLIASCSSTDALVQPPVMNTGKYRCSGVEVTSGKTSKIDFTNQMSDVVNSGISLSKSIFVQGDSTVMTGQGLVALTQSTNSINESTVQVKAALSSSSRVVIEKIGYSLKVSCQPK